MDVDVERTCHIGGFAFYDRPRITRPPTDGKSLLFRPLHEERRAGRLMQGRGDLNMLRTRRT